MIKLSPLLTEWKAKRTQKLRKPVFMNALTNGQFAAAYNQMLNGNGIYRGINGSAQYPYYIVQPGKTVRESKNTSNFYTGLLDGLPSWKNYPKRSRSIICSTSKNGASSFGNVLRVFPRNGGRIGICPNEDFWTSFPIVERRLKLQDMSYFNGFFIAIFYQISKDLASIAENLNEDTYDEFILVANNSVGRDHFIKAIYTRSDLYRLPWSASEETLIADVDEHFEDDWQDYFDELLNPEANGFQLTTIEKLDVTGSDYNELWTDAVSLLLSAHHTEELYQSPTKT